MLGLLETQKRHGAANSYRLRVGACVAQPAAAEPVPKTAPVPEVAPVPKTVPDQYQKRYSTSTKNGTQNLKGTYQEPKRLSAREALPDWLPETAWDEFCAHRKAIKRPVNAVSEKKLLSALCKLRDQGHDWQTVLDQSIANGWIGIFPPKGGITGGKSATDVLFDRLEAEGRA